nr:hypothetical protein [Tanacetum cinerariifolium]
CNKCKKNGHLAHDCRISSPNNNNNNHGNFVTTQNVVTGYECGVHGHFKKDCPKLKNGNRGNQRGNGNAPAKVYVVGNARTNPNSNVVTGNMNDLLGTINDSVNNMPPKRTYVAARAAAAAAVPMTAAAVEQLIEARVSATLANNETLRNSTNGQGDGSHNFDTRMRGTVCTPRECTYKDFLNYKPLTFKGTEGVVVLTQWIKKMESVFHISNCAVENQVKFATCTFLGNDLTWWNSHMKAVTKDVAYAMD